MRMWNVNVKEMCNQHLLGEHVETHMIVGCLNKKKSIKGYLEKGLIEVHNIGKRHNKLAKEISSRGFQHKSHLPNYKIEKLGKINSKENELELARRCKKCKEKQNDSL